MLGCVTVLGRLLRLKGVPRGLRHLVHLGAALAFVGLAASRLTARGLYHCSAEGEVNGARILPCSSARCAGLLNADCRRANSAAARARNARSALATLRRNAPEGSLQFAASYPQLLQLQAILDAPVHDGTARLELWRWAGIAIFVGACAGSAWLLAAQLWRAGLYEFGKIPSWKRPFWLMLAFTNLANCVGAFRHDAAPESLVSWGTYCNDWVAWLIERLIVLGASCSIAFALVMLWVLGNLKLTRRTLDPRHPDGAWGARAYVRILQRWCVLTPVLLVIPSFGWMATEARKPDFDVQFAVTWFVVLLPMLFAVGRLIYRAHGLRQAYEAAVKTVGDYQKQQEEKLPPDPTTPLLGADGWTPITGGLVLLGILWAIIEWSGGSRPLHQLGW